MAIPPLWKHKRQITVMRILLECFVLHTVVCSVFGGFIEEAGISPDDLQLQAGIFGADRGRRYAKRN